MQLISDLKLNRENQKNNRNNQAIVNWSEIVNCRKNVRSEATNAGKAVSESGNLRFSLFEKGESEGGWLHSHRV